MAALSPPFRDPLGRWLEILEFVRFFGVFRLAQMRCRPRAVSHIVKKGHPRNPGGLSIWQRPPRAHGRRRTLPLMGLGLRFRRAVRLRRPVTAFRHELVELRLVLGVPQPVKEIAELALLLLEPPQCFGAVFIKGTIAAGPLRAPPIASGAHLSAHALHLFLHAIHLALPMVHAVVVPATHSSAPDDERQRRKPQRPPKPEPKDHEDDPGGPS